MRPIWWIWLASQYHSPSCAPSCVFSPDWIVAMTQALTLMFALGLLSLCQGKKFSSLQNAATRAQPVAKKNPLRFVQEDITGRCDSQKLDCVDLVRSWGCDEVWAEKCPHRDHPQGAEYNRNTILESCAETCDMQMSGDKSLQPKSREERQKEKEKTAEETATFKTLDVRADFWERIERTN